MTIILPAYERALTTRLAIRSALDQTYDSFVLRIGDDSASDDVLSIVREFDDPRIQYHRNERRLGPRGNWAALLRSARTPFVASLNDDDEWLPEFLERLVPPMVRHEEVAMSFGDYWLMDEHGRTLDTPTDELAVRTRRNIMREGIYGRDRPAGLQLVAAWNAPQPALCAVLRTSMVAGIEFPPEVVSIHDMWLSYQIVMQGGWFYYTPERLSRYRLHPASLTQTVGFAPEEDYVFDRIIAENPDERLVLNDIEDYRAYLRWGRAGRMMTSGERVSSQRELLAAAPRLRGLRGLLANVAGRSSLVWRGFAGIQTIRHRHDR